MATQISLFGDAPRYPDGFRYEPELISRADEEALVEQIRRLPFREFEFHGYTGKRRVVSFGWRYDFNERMLQRVDDMPPFLLPLRETAARWAGLPAGSLQHALVTEYGAGAGIGWHRDKAEFDVIVGVSLLSACNFRLRRKRGGESSEGSAWERFTLLAEPRSAYLMSGAARTEWEHSIPGVDALRYSITFRNLRVDDQE